MSLMFEPLRKYADFQGRAQRSEFWLFWLFVMIVNIVIQTIIGAMASGAAMTGDPAAMFSGPAALGYGVLFLFLFAMLIPSLAVAVRRLHDTNRSGWWLLIGLIPFLGALVLLVFYVLDGTPGPNKYGEDPKNRAAEGGAVAAA